MTVFLFSNFASSVLVSSIAADTTTFNVAVGDGDKFPSPSAGNGAQLVMTDISGNREVVRLIGRVGDGLTVDRSQEGTPALAFAAGSRVELRLTAEVMRSFIQTGGGTLSGPLDLGGNEIRNALFPNRTQFPGGVRVQSVLPLDNNSTWSLVLPAGGGRPSLGNQQIMVKSDFAHLIFPFYGTLAQLPGFLKICDGTNNTPDMRGRFVRGAGLRPTDPQNITAGGAASVLSEEGGLEPAHNTDPTALSAGNLPAIEWAKTLQRVESGGDIEVITDIAIGYSATPRTHQHRNIEIPPHRHTVATVPPYIAMFWVMFA